MITIFDEWEREVYGGEPAKLGEALDIVRVCVRFHKAKGGLGRGYPGGVAPQTPRMYLWGAALWILSRRGGAARPPTTLGERCSLTSLALHPII